MGNQLIVTFVCFQCCKVPPARSPRREPALAAGAAPQSAPAAAPGLGRQGLVARPRLGQLEPADAHDADVRVAGHADRRRHLLQLLELLEPGQPEPPDVLPPAGGGRLRQRLLRQHGVLPAGQQPDRILLRSRPPPEHGRAPPPDGGGGRLPPPPVIAAEERVHGGGRLPQRDGPLRGCLVNKQTDPSVSCLFVSVHAFHSSHLVAPVFF